MSTLLEIQRAVARSILAHDDGAATAYIVADELAAEARLNIYRNTIIASLTTALRLSYPAVHRLVGAAFFESAARPFIETHPPRSADLDDYDPAFSGFLDDFAPAASIPYLAGVARLEWAVSRALHALDAEALDPARLGAIDPADHHRIRFVPHQSVGLVRADHPVDAIWRAVLAQDDAAMAAIDIGAGPVWLLVQRRETGIAVTRLDQAAWHFTARLCGGRSLQAAIDAAVGIDVPALLASHLVNGVFTGFSVDQVGSRRLMETPA
ncbi:MAG: HvfC/BufC family peptide modification chaperone [Stellaceae bacterium]